MKPTRKSLLLRIDPSLHAELEAWAQQDLRSVNGQIEFLLKEAILRRRKAEQREASTTGDPTKKTANGSD